MVLYGIILRDALIPIFLLFIMPCFPIRFVNRNDKEINVFLFF